MMKQGEKMVRHCRKERDSGYTSLHDFTVYSDIFGKNPDSPDHIQALFSHLRHAMLFGVPQRSQTCSAQIREFTLIVKPLETDLVAYAELSAYRGWGKNQHPIVQNYLHEFDPLTIATEVPVWSNAELNGTNGFIDIIRVTPDWFIEVSDFKPNAAKEKKASQQVQKYIELLIESTGIDRKWLIGTYFDDTHGFIINNA